MDLRFLRTSPSAQRRYWHGDICVRRPLCGPLHAPQPWIYGGGDHRARAGDRSCVTDRHGEPGRRGEPAPSSTLPVGQQTVRAVVGLAANRLGQFSDLGERLDVQGDAEPQPAVGIERAGLEIGLLGKVGDLAVAVADSNITEPVALLRCQDRGITLRLLGACCPATAS